MACAALALVCIVAVLAGMHDWTPAARLRRQAEAALTKGDYAAAERLGRRLTLRGGQRGAGLLIAGEAVARQKRPREALELLDQIQGADHDVQVAAELARGRILLTETSQLGAAEQSCRSVLAVEPENSAALERMSYVLGVQGRSWEAIPYRLALLRQKRFDLTHLLLLALGTAAEENPEDLARFAQADRNHPHVLCGLARAALRENETERALAVLRQALARDPHLIQAQAWLGSLLAAAGNEEDFFNWHSALPAAADEHPEIWFARGNWARRQGRPAEAIRCLWESVRIDPNHQTANYQLAQALIVLEKPIEAQPYLDRARQLGELVVAAKTFQLSGNPAALRKAAQLSDALGLVWESWGWRRILAQRGALADDDPLLTAGPFHDMPRSTGVESRLETYFERLLGENRGRTDVARLPEWKGDMAAYPLPQWRAPRGETASAAASRAAASRAFHFVDVASSVGLDFQYVNGSRPESAGEFMYEFSGGGVGVVDYDGDGWPDLYFTQGSDWPVREGQRRHLDRLFRNAGGERFVDVTDAAGIIEGRFSQGVAVGDVNNDGFPDLFVANIGRNSLYKNNGDGTFSDITEAAGISGSAWTTSCAIADLNGDGQPDIFAVNYVEGAGIFDQPCLLADGSPRLCTPHEFAAAEDQLHLNLGDGRFRDVSRDAGIEAPEGKGLGLVVADFGGSGRLDVFVANDSVPSFLFVNQTRQPADAPRFEERGFAAGVAVNGNGQPLAGMGVAAGDADGNGLVDLFVTTFRMEPKTLYLQQSGLLFIDGTEAAGLREPGFDMLGFGAQFIDADLDGRPDLVATNGHVGNLSQHGVPYQMPTQFFWNAGAGRFINVPAARLGPFFAGKYLGRGLARLDWNRDGREDFALSQLEMPAALVVNQTAAVGHFLTVQLRGVESSRDAVGAVVTLSTGGERQTQQLVAGDGYQASNQRQLVFGLGASDSIDEITVRWPSRLVQVLVGIPVDVEVTLIEGRDRPVVPGR